MTTKEDLNRQLEQVRAEIDGARRELKALRRNASESQKGKARASFITGKERMTEAAEAEERLEKLRKQEQEIRAKLGPKTG
jgi:hypothetical protein